MKRSLGILVALTASVLVLNSCNFGDDITLVWWNDYQQPTEDDPTADTSRYDFAQSVIEAFEEAHPNITVEQRQYDSYSAIASQIRTGLNSHVIPNIASVYPDDAATFGDAVLHAGQYFDDATIGFGKTTDAEGNVVDDPKTLKSDIDFNSEKTSYGDDEDDFLTLPYSRSSEALWINESVFELDSPGAAGHTASEDPEVNGGEQYIAPVAVDSKEAYEVPTTWSEMIELARQMKEDFPETFANQRDEKGWFTAVPICYDSGDNLFISLCQMMGIDYTSDTRATFNNEDVKKMLVQLKKWNNEGLICTADQLMMDGKYHSYSTSMVNYGKVFMLISSTTSGMYLYADGYKADVVSTPTAGKADFPIFDSSDAGEHYAMAQGPSLVLFRDNNEDVQKATFEFYKFLTNTDNSAGLAATTGYFPIRSSSNDTDAVKNIIAAADDEVSENTTTAASQQAKRDTYLGRSYKLNEQYTEEGCYFAATVYNTEFGSSSAARTAVGTMINSLFERAATTDEEIEDLVDKVITTAFSSAANN